MVLEAKPEVVDPDFLPFFMQSDRFMDRAVQISVGGLSPTINWKTLRKQEFVVPPLDRQRELVEVFRGVEDVLIQSEDAVRNCLNLNDSLVVNLFLGRWTGSPKVSTEVEALPVTWGVRTFQECLTKSPQTGKSPVPTSESTGYSVLNLSALSNGIDNGGFIAMDLKSISPNSYNTSIQIKDGDVFISRSNGNVEYVGITGQATHVPEKCIFPDTMWRIDINRDLIHPRLFVKYMLSPLGRREIRRVVQGGNGTMGKINRGHTKSIRMIVPPITDQPPMIATLNALDGQMHKLRTHVSSVQRSKRSILSRLLYPAAS